MLIMQVNNSLEPQSIIRFLQRKVEKSQGETVYEMLMDLFKQKTYIIDSQQAERILKKFFYAFKYKNDTYQYFTGQLGAMNYVLNKGVVAVETDPIKLANNVAYSIAEDALSGVEVINFSDVITADNVPLIINSLQKQIEWHDIYSKSPADRFSDSNLKKLLLYDLKKELNRLDPYSNRLSKSHTIASAWQKVLVHNNGIYLQYAGQYLDNFSYGKYRGTLGAVSYLAERKRQRPKEILANNTYKNSATLSSSSLAKEVLKERTLEILIPALKKACLEPSDLLTVWNFEKIEYQLKTQKTQKQVLRKKYQHSL